MPCLTPFPFQPPRRYTFKAKWLVDEAVTHCSWPGSGARCYQARRGALQPGRLQVACNIRGIQRHAFQRLPPCPHRPPRIMAPNLCTAPSLQRLEFLGDAVLDVLVTLHFFQNFE